MRVVVTGATGFVGRHVVSALLREGHAVTAVARDEARAQAMPWFGDVKFVAHDIHRSDASADARSLFGEPEVLMHLAWKGLPAYKDLFHIEENLPGNYHFVKSMIEAGTRQVLVAGTCFEYGLRNGCLGEDAPTAPVTAYGLAKDTLRKFLELLTRDGKTVFQWGRLFYMYGPGQHEKSLLAQLDRAVENGDTAFNMSGGEQLRDYLPVEEVGARLVKLMAHPEYNGTTNICSGEPISVRRLVERHLAGRGASMNLNLGHYPYADYEPMAFWGDPSRCNAMLGGISS